MECSPGACLLYVGFGDVVVVVYFVEGEESALDGVVFVLCDVVVGEEASDDSPELASCFFWRLDHPDFDPVFVGDLVCVGVVHGGDDRGDDWFVWFVYFLV